MSFSCDSAAPISLSCSRRRNRSSSVSRIPPGFGRPDIGRRRTALLDADRAHLRHIGDPLEDFLDTVHLQGPHALFQADRQDLSDAGVLLDPLLGAVGGVEQFWQAYPC